MKPEQALWRNHLRPALQKIPGLVYERVELRTGASGMPDVVYTYGKTAWIENKVSSAKEGISLARWTKVQRIWARKHVEAGGTVFLCFMTPTEKLIIDPLAVINKQKVSDRGPHILGHWSGPIPPEELKHILRIP